MAAWAIVKDYDPMAVYIVHTDEVGNPYFTTEAGAFVRTTVIIKGQSLTEVLPVLDNNNKPQKKDAYTVKTKYKEIDVAPLNAFDINSAYKRCLVKNLAMHGLGAQVYIDGEGHGLDLEKGLSKVKAVPKKKTKKAGGSSF
jgi:hypothetical protein